MRAEHDERPEPIGAARTRIRFVGGPWDGDSGRYYGVDGHGDVPVSAGRYAFAHVDETGDVVYAYRASRR